MRRGFTVVELLIGLAIAAVLLTALFSALQSSIAAYSRSSADGVNRLTSRLFIERVALLIRTGSSFGPMPSVSTMDEVSSHYLELTTSNGQNVAIVWNSVDKTIEMNVDGVLSTVLGGVTQFAGGTQITPFRLQYAKGSILERVTINLVVVPDLEYVTSMDESGEIVRLTASIMPRAQLY